MLSGARKNLILELLKKISVNENNIEIFDEALTHPSFNFEENKEHAPDYERLEFLGDSVLRLVVSNYLFDKYVDYDEGKLTKIRSYLVSDEFISKIAIKLNLSKYVNIGVHEEKDGGLNKVSILACAMEAVLGAVFKSSGFQAASEFIYKIYDDINIDVNSILYFYNSKEILQQYTQGKNKDLPVYKLLEESGESHDKTYKVGVFYNEEELGSGIAKSKKEAEKIAALNALIKLNLVEGNAYANE